MAAPDVPVLVCGPGRGGESQVPADRGRARAACPGVGLDAVRVDREGAGQRAGGGTGIVVEGTLGGRSRCAAAPGLERGRAHHLPRARARHRPGAARAPGLPLHARWRRGRIAGNRERRRGLMASTTRRADKALILEVPLSRECTKFLCVIDEHRRPIKFDGNKFQGEHVESNGNVVLVKNFFEENKRIYDVSRYYIREGICRVFHDGRYCICDDSYITPHCDLSGQQIYHGDIHEQDLGQHLQEQPGSIVLLLESPHKEEYGENLTDRRAPAASRSGTGGNIDRCLDTVLMHIQLETGLIAPRCHVVISNPVQFQTSLHAALRDEHRKKLNKKLRDNVWLTLWAEPYIQQCFRSRLGRYHPKMIINACTSNLKPCVTSCVEEWNHGRNPVVPLYEVPHPASWHNLRPERINP